MLTVVSRVITTSTAPLAFIFVSVLLDMMSMGILGPVWPTLIEGLAGSGAKRQPVCCISGHGVLSDRFGRRPVILISTGGLTLDCLIMALAPNIGWLMVGSIVAGLTSATIATASAYIADVCGDERRVRAYGIVGAAFNAGMIAGPIVGGVLGGWSLGTPFWISSAILYGIFVLPESLAVERRRVFSWRRANPVGAMGLLRSDGALLSLAGILFLSYSAALVFPTIFVLDGRYRTDRGVGI